MLGKFGLAAAALMLSAAPALAQGACSNPYAPAALDGSKATEKQLVTASHDAHDFITASDEYQQCMMDDLKSQKDAAAKAKDAKPLDPSIEAGVNKRIDDNQRMKEKVGGEFHAALLAYCKRPDANPVDCKSVPK